MAGDLQVGRQTHAATDTNSSTLLPAVIRPSKRYQVGPQLRHWPFLFFVKMLTSESFPFAKPDMSYKNKNTKQEKKSSDKWNKMRD